MFGTFGTTKTTMKNTKIRRKKNYGIGSNREARRGGKFEGKKGVRVKKREKKKENQA